MAPALEAWNVVATNLPEHARNRIHTDAGAQAAGFPRALVAGVTTYAYLTHPVVAAWGEAWLASGGGEVRFHAPVFDGDLVCCTPVVGETGTRIEARVGDAARARAVLAVWERSGSVPPLRPGDELAPLDVVLTGELGHGYGKRAGDDVSLYERDGIVHPAVWPALANQLVHAQLAQGSWIHVRSRIDHHALAHDGQTAHVEARVVDRFERRGERAVLDVRIEADGVVVASLEHEAIVRLG